MPDEPNILVIWGEDIGVGNLSCYSEGLMGYRTPNNDRIAQESARFADYYTEQSCTKVSMPGADIGLQTEDPTIATALKARGHATRQFGKNHFGDRDEFLPMAHGFDEFFGNLHRLNSEEERELRARSGSRTPVRCQEADGDLRRSVPGRCDRLHPTSERRRNTVLRAGQLHAYTLPNAP